jgi:hypothetical protein
MNDYERSVLENVEKFGWHCTSAFPNEGANTPRFSYTVGLHHTYSQPEFIIFGLESKIAYGILSALAGAAADKRMYPLDKPCDALVDNYECAFVEVPRHRFNDFVFSALWFYAEVSFPLYQVVWPDSEGRYPWNKDAEPDPSHPQPVLALGQ